MEKPFFSIVCLCYSSLNVSTKYIYFLDHFSNEIDRISEKLHVSSRTN